MNALAPTNIQKLQLEVITIRRDLDPCGREAAAKYGTVMLGGYPDIRVMDPKTFSVHLEALLAEYPVWLCAMAQKEIPREILKYKLDIAGIKAWLEERMKERRQAYAEALAAQRAAEQAEKDRAEREQIDREAREFQAWLKDNPDGTYRQWCGLPPATGPIGQMVDDIGSAA